MLSLWMTCRCSVMPTTRNIRSFPSLLKIPHVMCCTISLDSFRCSGNPVYDDDIIQDVCENMGTIMFQLGNYFGWNGYIRRASTETQEGRRGSYRNGSVYKLWLLSVVQT